MRNDEAADVMIGVGIKPCVHFHFASEHALKLGRLPVPVGNFFRARGEFAVFRYNSKLLLSRERLFAQATAIRALYDYYESEMKRRKI